VPAPVVARPAVDFQVRSATAIRRHETLVKCAFSFCWDTWFDQSSTSDNIMTLPESVTDDSGERWHRIQPYRYHHESDRLPLADYSCGHPPNARFATCSSSGRELPLAAWTAIPLATVLR
jgi:hypothetical protein